MLNKSSFDLQTRRSP